MRPVFYIYNRVLEQTQKNLKQSKTLCMPFDTGANTSVDLNNFVDWVDSFCYVFQKEVSKYVAFFYVMRSLHFFIEKLHLKFSSHLVLTCFHSLFLNLVLPLRKFCSFSGRKNNEVLSSCQITHKIWSFTLKKSLLTPSQMCRASTSACLSRYISGDYCS